MGKMNYAYVCLIFLFILSCLYIFDFTVRNELVLHSISVFEHLDIFVSHFPGLLCECESQSCISILESGIMFLAF